MRRSYSSLAAAVLALGVVALAVLGAGCLSAGSALCLVQTATGTRPELDVPYAATRSEVVDAMIEMAEVEAGDRVVDLGTGDGRILIAAAREGARGIGVDIDPAMIGQAQARARQEGVADRVEFRVADLFETPLAEADVVTLFLLPEVNLRLRPRLLAELRPGARIVSHAFDMGEWRPDRAARVGGARVYLWIVPASVGGRWTLIDGAGRARRLELDQKFQVVRGLLDGQPIAEGEVNGNRLRFVVAGREGERSFEGLVEDGIIRSARTGPVAPGGAERWRATRDLRRGSRESGGARGEAAASSQSPTPP